MVFHEILNMKIKIKEKVNDINKENRLTTEIFQTTNQHLEKYKDFTKFYYTNDKKNYLFISNYPKNIRQRITLIQIATRQEIFD